MWTWGDERVDWAGINDAARYISDYLVKYGRINVRDYKEKYGTVRIYCSLGWSQFHSITHPRHCYARYPKWLWSLDCRVGSKVIQPLNRIVIRYHAWLYRRAYKNAIQKWPHLKCEILHAADFHELLKGLDDDCPYQST